MKDCKSLTILLDSNNKLSRDISPQILEEIEAIKDVPYQKIINSLVYAMIDT